MLAIVQTDFVDSVVVVVEVELRKKGHCKPQQDIDKSDAPEMNETSETHELFVEPNKPPPA